MVLLQVTAAGEAAKHESAKECKAILKKVLRRAQALKDKHPVWCDQQLIISHDDAPFFTGIGDMPGNPGEEYIVIEQPPASPDCHKVIEHPIHSIKSRFRKAFTQLLGRVTHAKARQLLIDVIKEAVSQESVMKDAGSLPATLESIGNNGGGWADTGLR